METCEHCDQPPVARGWCSKHYDTWKRNGDPLRLKKQKVKGTICIVDGCQTEARSKGLCGTHYARQRRWGSTDLHPNVGASREPLYGTWRSVKRRWCCPDWGDFRVFAADVGNRPDPLARVVPIDKDAPLGRDNFKWVVGQQRAKRNGTWKKPANKRWAQANSEKQHGTMLRFRFGLAKEKYDEMSTAQDGRCAICTEKCSTRLAVDHCHRTGTIRGLLCRACNTALGGFRDDPDLLRRAIEYLGGHAST